MQVDWHNKEVPRADVRTLGKKERKVYEQFKKHFFENCRLWKVGLVTEKIERVNPLRRAMKVPRGGRQYRRCDLICADSDHVYVVEFKVHITPAAIGQVMIYQDAVQRRLNLEKKPIGFICGESIDSDVQLKCEDLGIFIALYPS